MVLPRFSDHSVTFARHGFNSDIYKWLGGLKHAGYIFNDYRDQHISAMKSAGTYGQWVIYSTRGVVWGFRILFLQLEFF